MKSRLRHMGVFSLSAIDLFASAMGAFIIITIILMPDYQKEVRLEGHLEYIESLKGETEAIMNDTEKGIVSMNDALSKAQSREMELQAEQEIMSSELETIRAKLQARNDKPPPPPPSPVETEEKQGSNLVTFRFLGLKTDKTRILLLVDMNKYLADHEALVAKTVMRALDSLKPGYEFGILGFQQLDSGPRYHRFPENGGLVAMNPANRAQAQRFARQLAGKFEGSSSLRDAFAEALKTPAEAVILLSDGLPNPAYNGGLPPRALIQDIVMSNTRGVEIHAVTIGDYFKYKGTVEFMENLARANSGGFLALAQ
ncbi:MAG: vWA domain-containing protein [Lysobacterales bacterium]